MNPTLDELLQGYRTGKLPVGALFEALTARGPIPAGTYPQEIALVERLQAEGQLDPRLGRALLMKLSTLRVADEDDTKPKSPGPAPEDATIVKPVPPPGVPADDATIVRPRSPVPRTISPPPDVESTILRSVTAVPIPPPPSAGLEGVDIDPAALSEEDPWDPSAASEEEPWDPSEDKTVVQPAVPPARGGGDPTSDRTVVDPLTGPQPVAADGATGITGNTGASGVTGATGATGGKAVSTSSQASWNRLASAEGGDFVTVGSHLKGRFYLDKEIGRGGMGVVYKARDDRKVEARDRDPYVAVKVLNDEFRRHPDSLISLQRESRRSQQLAHDNIVRVFDFDKDGTIVYMTMEYIDGSDLKGLIREKAPMGLSKARPLIEGMARGLARAHADGVVHSDFKPANVMVTRSGIPKVFDFGIARAGKMGDAVGEQTVFDAGTLGALTPAYASLEMIQGKDPEIADDVYALGCVAYELLTGRHPFDKVSAEVALKEGRKAPSVSGLTKRQNKALAASVAFTREQRLKTTMELVEGLRELNLRERAMPFLLVGVPSILVLAGGAWGFLSYRHNAQLTSLVQRFNADRPDHYANEEEARQALKALGEEDRRRVLLDQSDVIQTFLLLRIDAYWNPDHGRYDYPHAQSTFALRDELKLYSPTLDAKRAEVDRQKNDLLNSLDTQLNAQIDSDAIFETQPDNAVATLARIRAIDPTSGLLKNTQLELKYDTAIGKSIDANALDQARLQLAVARRLYPDSARFTQRSSQIDQISSALAQQQQQEAAAASAAQQRTQSVQTLSALVDSPANTNEWRNSAADAYRAARKLLESDPRLDEQANRLKLVLAAQVKEQSASGDAKGAIDIAGFGIDLFPGDAALANVRQGLLDEQNKLSQEAQTKTQRIDKAKSRVADLLAQPAGTAVWLQDLKTALNDFRSQVGADSPDYAQSRSDVVAGVAKLARARLADGALDDADHIVRSGQQIDAAEPVFQAVLAEIATARGAANDRVAQEQAKKLADARQTLAGLSANPAFTADWQRSATAAVAALGDDAAPESRHALDSLADALAAESDRLSAAQQLPQARLAIDFGLKLLPRSAKLADSRVALDKLQRETAAKTAQEGVDAEVTSRIESVKSAAAANDIPKARESPARVRALAPDNPFLKTDGPQILTGAYLRVAADSFLHKNYQDAADVLGQAVKVIGDRPELRNARQRYEIVATIKKAGDQPLASADYDRLKKDLEETRKADTPGLEQLEADLKSRGQLAEKTLAERLEKLKPSASALAVVPEAAPITKPEAAPAKPEISAPVGAPAKPETAPKPEASNKAEAPVAAAPVAPAQAVVATGPDPCNKSEMIGKGRICADAVGSRKGPRMVVIPGEGGGAAFALSRAEVSIANFNDFCAATGKCSPHKADDEDAAAAPINNISVAQAREYAEWLTFNTGYVYRLPTDSEWSHAAGGGSGWKQAEDSNCVPPSGTAGSGGTVSPKGREPNPWGLVNMTGNVWEWATAGGKLVARGGSFNEFWSTCTVDARRDDNGQPKGDVGFRILRELR